LESLTKLAQGKRGWDALGRLGFPPREQVGLPHGDLVWEQRRGQSPNQVALRPRQGATFFPSFALSVKNKIKLEKRIKPYTFGLNRRFSTLNHFYFHFFSFENIAQKKDNSNIDHSLGTMKIKIENNFPGEH